MRLKRWMMAVAVVCVMSCGVALAWMPKDGVEVRLAKNPGGVVAVRRTDASGNVTFGIVPSGNYVLTFEPPINGEDPAEGLGGGHAEGKSSMQMGGGHMHLEITGAAEGRIRRDMESGQGARAVMINVTLDGKTPLIVEISSGR